METKEKIKRLRAQIAKLQGYLKNAKGDEKAEIQKHIDKYQSQLDALLAENPHNDGTGRKPISSRTSQNVGFVTGLKSSQMKSSKIKPVKRD